MFYKLKQYEFYRSGWSQSSYFCNSNIFIRITLYGKIGYTFPKVIHLKSNTLRLISKSQFQLSFFNVFQMLLQTWNIGSILVVIKRIRYIIIRYKRITWSHTMCCWTNCCLISEVLSCLPTLLVYVNNIYSFNKNNNRVRLKDKKKTLKNGNLTGDLWLQISRQKIEKY